MSIPVLKSTLEANNNLRELVCLLDLSINWTMQKLDAARLSALDVPHEKWKNVCDALLQVVEDKQTVLWGADALHLKDDPQSLGLLGISQSYQYLFDKYPTRMPSIDFEKDPEWVKRDGLWVKFQWWSNMH